MSICEKRIKWKEMKKRQIKEGEKRIKQRMARKKANKFRFCFS